MSNYTQIIKGAFKNKVIHYIFSRYATYIIQFVNSLFIAVYLGPYYLGVWGFITLIIQYLNHLNLGIAHSVNAILAVNKDKEWYVQKVVGTSLTMLIGLSFFVGLFFLANEIWNFDIGNKYNFSTYAPLVLLIGVLGYFNSLLSNVFRVYGRVVEIAVNQSAFPILMLLAILFFKSGNLIWALVGANLLAFFLSLCLYLIKSPVRLKPIFITRLAKAIQIKGWHLFVYNTSFYFIIISTRSFVSAYYSVEEFGYFTFAFTLSNSVLLLLQAFSFLIYPKLLNRMATAQNDGVINLLTKLRDAYITTSHLLIHVVILIFPIFVLFFPQYNQSIKAFNLIALTVVLYTNSFGYSGLLIARNKERRLSFLSFSSLIINIVIAYVLSVVFHVTFAYIIMATMITYFIYVYMLGRVGRDMLNLNTIFASVIKDVFPLKLILPFALNLILAFLSLSYIFLLLPVVLFGLLNYKTIIGLRPLVKTMVLNSNVIDI